MNKIDDRLFDVRSVERNLKKGLISRQDYDKYLKDLPDDEKNAKPLSVPEDPADLPPSKE